MSLAATQTLIFAPPLSPMSHTDDLLNALASAGYQKKSKRAADDDGGHDMEIYRNAGKKAAALLDPFAIPAKAFLIGIQHDRGGRVDDTLDPSVIKRHLHFYDGILRLIPGLRSALDSMTPQQVAQVIQAIMKGMSDGRSTDLASVKHRGVKYVPENMHSKADVLDPPVPEVEDKSMRGIFHPQLGRFLCPRRDLEEYDEDPECGMQALQDGTFPMKSSRWPAGFYEEGVYDPSDKTIGLLRNHTVIRFYKHLFLGPAAVTSDCPIRRSAKPSKNRAWGLNSVDSHIIAYAHVITYITVSHAQHWTQTIGDMDLQDLYWRIVEILEDNSDPWVQETLKWWNRHCNSSNGSMPLTGKKMNNDATSSEDDMAQVRARRARGPSIATKNKAQTDVTDYTNFKAPPPTSWQTERAPHKKASADIIFDDEDSGNEDLLRIEPKGAPHISMIWSDSQSEYVAAHKTARIILDDEDSDDEGPLRTKLRGAPLVSTARPSRPEHGVGHKRTFTHVDSDDEDLLRIEPKGAPHVSMIWSDSQSEYAAAHKTARIILDDEDSDDEGPLRTKLRGAPLVSTARPSRPEHGVGHKRTFTHVNSDDEDLLRTELKGAPHVSMAWPSQSEHAAARKKTSACTDLDSKILPEALPRKGPAKVSYALPARLKRPEHEGAHAKSVYGQSRPYPSSPLVNEDNGDNYGDHVSQAHRTQQDSDVGNTIQDYVNTAGGDSDLTAGSPPSQLSGDLGNEARVDGQGHVQPIPTKRIKLIFSAATKDDNDTAPQKKAKKASTRAQAVPPRRNAARTKRANGF